MLGILGLLGLTASLSMIFGWVALRQIKQTGQNGAGNAKAGIALSVVWLVALIAVGVFGPGDAERDSSGTVTEAGRPTPQDIELRDCLNELPSPGRVLSVKVVPCTRPHAVADGADLTEPISRR